METDFDFAGEPLTDREKEVLSHFANGMFGPDIARKLFLSHHTVTSHKKRIQRKLGTKSLPHSVAEALRQGIIR